jgi:hypothetical protein
MPKKPLFLSHITHTLDTLGLIMRTFRGRYPIHTLIYYCVYINLSVCSVCTFCSRKALFDLTKLVNPISLFYIILFSLSVLERPAMTEPNDIPTDQRKPIVIRGEHGYWKPGSVPNPSGHPKRGESIAELLVIAGNRRVKIFRDGKPVTTEKGRDATIAVRKYLFQKVYDLAVTGKLTLDREVGGRVETKELEVDSLAQWMEIMEWLVRHMDNGQPASTMRAMEWNISDNVLRVIEHTDTGSVRQLEEANDEQ